MTPLITNDATVLGLLAIILGFVFYTSKSTNSGWQKFYKVVPAVLMCYFLPSLLNTFGIVDGNSSQVYFVASRYLLPACIVLLTISVDLPAIMKLGPKALILFFTGTLGIVIGGPIALLTMSSLFPELLNGAGPDAVWRGMTTVAGSWVGGTANQTAMKEIYEVGNEIFSTMVTVDIIVANIWMAVLLILASNAKKIDAHTGADTTALNELRTNVEEFEKKHARIPKLDDIMLICAIGFGVTGFAHFCSDLITPFMVNNYPNLEKYSFHSQFFWMIIIASAIGIALSFTKLRKVEAAGASKFGSAFLYILIATVGLHMDVTQIFDTPKFFVLGLIWMLVHAGLMLGVAKLIKAPLFYMAVGSQANVGGAASAPVVASAFHPALAPVGVLLAVLGYAVGTYAAWFCGLVLQAIAS
ncbi:DUF819 family protein [uncultured Psychrosphaera sp.]|uniref:DUF819 family protein n=1 Tax=uncultured Psychrosphaera sp. TaxID=1403522 RepID=UPI00262D21AA|nr:DUF819 family protein [uncultured Psychrosphaera sp.]